MNDETFGIVPHFFYRKTDAETRRIIGLKPTQIEEAIKTGDLDPPATITSTGRATGWQGTQLISHIRKRQKRAADEHKRKIAAAAASPTPAKKTRATRRSKRD